MPRKPQVLYLLATSSFPAVCHVMRVTNYWKLIKDTHSGKDFIQLYFCMWCCGDVSGGGPLSSHATDFFNCLIWRATWWASGQQLVGNIIGQLGGQQLVVNTKPSGQVSWWQAHNFPGICICICCLLLRQYCLPGGQQLWWYCLQEFEASSSQRGASAGSRLKEKYLTATENFLSMSTSHIF